MNAVVLHFSFTSSASRQGTSNLLPFPTAPLRHKRNELSVKFSSASETDPSTDNSSSSKGSLSVVLDVPKTLWRRALRPLNDFGFSRSGIWEGGVGLFIVSGTVLLALSLAWLRGFQLRSKFRKYFAVFEFDHASGISTGTPVRIRGVTVGNVVRVIPSLKSIEAVVEVEDEKIIIPRNSIIEVNQSGLLMETLIDITPGDPLPAPSTGPLNEGCAKEGLIVCDRQKIKGQQGVSLDELVGIFTRIGRDMEKIGVSKSFSLAEKVAGVVEEAKPLLRKVKAMADDVEPLLAQVNNRNLLKEVENLTKSLTRASEDLRNMNSAIMAPENTELIQKSIYSLIFTLKNIESITSDVLAFTGDEATRKNIKLLIKSLSRLL